MAHMGLRLQLELHEPVCVSCPAFVLDELMQLLAMVELSSYVRVVAHMGPRLQHLKVLQRTGLYQLFSSLPTTSTSVN